MFQETNPPKGFIIIDPSAPAIVALQATIEAPILLNVTMRFS